MKKNLIFISLVLLTSGCGVLNPVSDTSGLLVPYYTATAVIDEVHFTNEMPEQVEAIPQPTATPRIHVVTLNDTISSIALQYGVTIDAILLANPDIEPTAMIVGDEVIIPGGDNTNFSAPDPSLVTKAVFGTENCLLSAGGLWCGVMLKNIADVDLEFPIITFSFTDGGGEILETLHVPAVLRRLPFGEEIPVVVFLEAIPKGYTAVELTLFAIEETPPDQAENNIVIENTSISLNGSSGTISGSARVETADDSLKSDITIAAVAINADGDLVGVRRIDSSVAVDEIFEFSVTVFAAGGQVADLILFTEVY